MANATPRMAKRRITVRYCDSRTGVKDAAIAFYPGTCSLALQEVVAQRLGIDGGFYVVDSDGDTVPLCGALQDGEALVAVRSEVTAHPGARALSPPRAPRVSSAPPRALSPKPPSRLEAINSPLLLPPVVESPLESPPSLISPRNALEMTTPRESSPLFTPEVPYSLRKSHRRSFSETTRLFIEQKMFTLDAEPDALDALTRYNRLTTNLANERTLLAWIRTALATIGVMEKVLTYKERCTALVGGSILGACAISMVLYGWERWKKLKHMMDYKSVLPKTFNRASLQPLLGTLVILFVVIITSNLLATLELDIWRPRR